MVLDTAETRKMGLQRHVCEVQLMLRGTAEPAVCDLVCSGVGEHPW